VAGRNARGYTLIELIVVLVLVGLLGSLTLPRLRQSLLSDDLQGSTRQLAGLMRELRNEAQRQQQDRSLRFDLDAGIFWVEAGDMTADERAFARENASSLPEGVRISDIWLKSKGVFSGGEVAIAVTRKGYVQPSAIHLADDAGREFTLNFQPFLPKERTYNDYIDFRDR
jgi:prepilin-type N-terminal cleavage/methylation domain-containing protein